MYQSSTSSAIVVSLPFTVTDEETLVFASINVFTKHPIMLQISMSDPRVEEYQSWKVQSVAGKYWSYLEPVSLTKGDYFFSVIRQDQPGTS